MPRLTKKQPIYDQETIDRHHEKTLTALNRVNIAMPSKLGIFKRVFAGSGSKTMAIKAKCLDCCNLNVDEIRNCQCFICPLWKYRPFQPV